LPLATFVIDNYNGLLFFCQAFFGCPETLLKKAITDGEVPGLPKTFD
jgi:hypothetical protein